MHTSTRTTQTHKTLKLRQNCLDVCTCRMCDVCISSGSKLCVWPQTLGRCQQQPQKGEQALTWKPDSCTCSSSDPLRQSATAVTRSSDTSWGLTVPSCVHMCGSGFGRFDIQQDVGKQQRQPPPPQQQEDSNANQQRLKVGEHAVQLKLCLLC